jgi:para-aminobenzoate synthetase component 1
VKRSYHTFPVKDITILKRKMLNWADQFNICCLLDNHNYSSPYQSHECLVGVGVLHSFAAKPDFFASLSSFVSQHHDWIFAHFNYDLKNKIEEGLSSENPDETCFPEHFLFVPEVVLQLKGEHLIIGLVRGDAVKIYSQIMGESAGTGSEQQVTIEPRISKSEYVAIISELQQHIHQGDCYEINFCQEFFGAANINPVETYHQLTSISPNPFSAFYKLEDKYVLSASPERFLMKEGSTIISQPIKGTSSRNQGDEVLDNANRQALFESEKDRRENVMVVDLVRNDLSKICREGSVKVTELYKVYSFPNVHQMISTITGVLNEHLGFGDILKATFPMGSMTGAPKRRVIELIEKYERSKRGIYSGTIGYISPSGDFDFNVVIRSLVYNAGNHYLSFHVGSAITAYCSAEEEYKECLLKGSAMMHIFSGGATDVSK